MGTSSTPSEPPLAIPYLDNMNIIVPRGLAHPQLALQSLTLETPKIRQTTTRSGKTWQPGPTKSPVCQRGQLLK